MRWSGVHPAPPVGTYGRNEPLESGEMRMKKRLLSVFLCICLVLGLVPVTARAAEPTTVTTAQELESTMEAGGEIKLGVDIAVSRPLGVEDGKEVTLDLNGHAITSTGSFTLLSVGQSGSSDTTTGKLTVTDSSVGTLRGSITGQSKLFRQRAEPGRRHHSDQQQRQRPHRPGPAK